MPEEPDYDAAATEDEIMDEPEEGDMDQTFLDYAAEAGFDETKAAALKKAIERCVELQDAGAYADDAMMDMGEDIEI